MLKSVSPRDGAAFVISLILLGFFGYFEWWALSHITVSLSEQIILGLMTALTNLAFLVAGYWIGSSKSSQTNAQQAQANAQQAIEALHAVRPAPTAPSAPPTGTPVAVFLALAAISLALFLSGQPANAASQPARPPRDGLTRSSEAAPRPSHPPNCWGPLCVWPTPLPPSPTNIPDVTDTKGILRLASDNKANLIDFLTKEDAEASTIIPGSNPAHIWDPIAHMCLAGVGPPGPDHVQGLIEFVESLSGPAQLPPTIEGYPIDPEHIRLGIKITNSVINAIASNGYPEPLRQSCGSLINDIALDVQDVSNNALSINALIMRVLPLVIK